MVNWSQLPQELLVSVAELLPLPSYFRFRAVCKSWNVAVRYFRPLSPVLQPWISLLVPKTQGQPGKLTFTCLDEERFYHYEFPADICGNLAFLGKKDGWLVVQGQNGKIIVVNPLSRNATYLPPFATLFNTLHHGAFCAGVDQVVLSAAPSSASGFVSVITYGADGIFHQIAFAGPGDASWTHLYTLGGEDGFLGWEVFEDVVFCGGIFVAVVTSGRLLIFDPASPSGSRLFFRGIDTDPWDDFALDRRVFLVPAFDCLLCVRRQYSGGRFTGFFTIKWNDEADWWMEAEDLGSLSLCLDSKGSILLSREKECGNTSKMLFINSEFDTACVSEVGLFDVAKKMVTTASELSSLIGGNAIWFRASLS